MVRAWMQGLAAGSQGGFKIPSVARRQAGSQGSAIEVAGRPPVAVTAALRALPATDRRLLAGRAWCTDLETALRIGGQGLPVLC
jgi:hypothetical protein